MNLSTNAAFLQHANIYEVNLRQYSAEGNIQSFLKHLPRLKDMGVDILWMMPVHPIGLTRRKGALGSYYSIKDFCDINPEFGTKEDFKQLVEAVHANGMKIIIDWVANHAAWDNVWTHTNPEFFVRDEHGNFKSPFDWDDVIQFDHSNEAEQQTMQLAMKYWVREFNIDGFRADLAHLTPLAFWVNARQALNEIKKGLVWLAETEDINYYTAFDIVYAWKWMHATEDFFKGNNNIKTLTGLLENQLNTLPSSGMELFFTSNHDENSWNGTEYEKYGIYARALAVMNYTYPNAVPLIYSGQELPNFKRLRFFEKDVIEWNGQPALHDFYKTLAMFHKNCFAGGQCSFLYTEKNVLAFQRTLEEKALLVFINLDKEMAVADYQIEHGHGAYKNIFTGEIILISGNIHIALAPGEFLVIQK